MAALALGGAWAPLQATAAAPGPSGSHAPAVTATSVATTESLPGTTLEADARNDDTNAAAWLIGSGVAAAVAVAVGGSILNRRVR